MSKPEFFDFYGGQEPQNPAATAPLPPQREMSSQSEMPFAGSPDDTEEFTLPGPLDNSPQPVTTVPAAAAPTETNTAPQDPWNGEPTECVDVVPGMERSSGSLPVVQPGEQKGHWWDSLSPRTRVLTGIAAVAAVAGLVSCGFYNHSLHKEPVCAAESDCTPNAFTLPTPEATADTSATDTGLGTAPTPSESSSVSPTTTKPVPSVTRPSVTASPAPEPSPARKSPQGHDLPAGGASVVLDPKCGVWNNQHRQAPIRNGNTALVVVDARGNDGGACKDSDFYSGVTLHESPSAQSGQVNAGVSFNTVGSRILNGSVLPVLRTECNEGQEKNGGMTRLWIYTSVNGQKGWITATNTGFTSGDTLVNKFGYTQHYGPLSKVQSGSNC